ncbi:39S ribosomal protein L2, mitochondrial [Diprion similis]|uniref:39S ribosomal protein L2, mitochondrial n=1 Tax=Diprion similis TaxID=362088 RepID=UPI001EF96201|nr:39S ribosomal protein L2, mitochondrial [Diprion similis]
MSAAVIATSLVRRVLSIPVIRQSAWCFQQERNVWKGIDKPKPGVPGTYYRRIIHFPEEYTVKPLRVTNLGGRDPVTGRLVAKGIGGGIKHKYHWINWKREGPKSLDEKPKEERVLQVLKDGCRTAFIALVGCGQELNYILATQNMKPGDIIRTSQAIPRIPVKANEGDAFPLGALPTGTQVHSIEKYPGYGGSLVHAAGTFATILRYDGTDRVIVKMPSKREFSLHKSCMATVGRLSNHLHGSTPIGSAQNNRLLGNRPRSGLWKRKEGRHGRKIRPLPPVKEFSTGDKSMNAPAVRLTLDL